MKIAVFGATGTVGKQVVIQALGLDHQVKALVRPGNDKLQAMEHRQLHIVEGNVFDSEAVSKVIEGCDAVICVLGAGRKGEVRARGTQIIIDAMKKLGVKRLICQSTLGAGDSRANLNFVWKHIMFGWLLKAAYADHQLQEEYVKASELDWTIVRPAAFTDGPATGQFKHGFPATEKTSLKISRADVALFLLTQLDSPQYLHKTPALAY